MQTLSMKHPTTLAGTIWRAIRRFAQSASAAREQRHALHHLGTLDEHLLSDIGLARKNISDAVGLGKQARRKANII